MRWMVGLFCLAGSLSAAVPSESQEIRDGADLLAAMHDRYRDSWYESVVFKENAITLNPDGTKSKTPPDGGIKGPSGDNYLYAHFQIDAQGSYRLGKGWTAIVSALNLNNEVFGFYNGSPQFVVQREYYKPTYSFGFRWDLRQE